MTATIRVSNPGNTDLNVFIDPRRTGRTFYSLLALDQASGVPLPLPGTSIPPEWR